MGSINLGNNIASLRGQRSFADATSLLTQASLRLSTGLRINKASDDAAGLAVSFDLSTRARLHDQAYRNINDGISQLNIASGAIENLRAIIIRIAELAEQSANGVYSNTQRLRMQEEAQAIRKEYNRIIETTVFNSSRVFNGSDSSIAIHAGVSSDTTISTNLAAVTTGDGTFASARSFGSTFGVWATASEDFNQDGNLDVISIGNGRLAFHAGNGDGTFKAARTQADLADQYKLLTADFNGDSKIDLLSFSDATGTTSVSLGNGDGSFKAPSLYQITDSNDIAIGDLNGDGMTDFGVISDGGLSIFIGNGNGTFSAARTYAIDVDATSIIFGDLDNNGTIDAVFGSNDPTPTYGVLLGNQNGTFAAEREFSGINYGRELKLADLNDDGRLDLISASYDDGIVEVLFGNGNGTFLAGRGYNADNSVRRITVDDMNGDGWLDILSNGDQDEITLLLNNGDGTFRIGATYTTVDPTGLSIGDFNQDGAKDFVVGELFLSGINVFLGNTRQTSLERISGMNVNSVAKARSTLEDTKRILGNISTVAGAIGASLSRLQSAANLSIDSRDKAFEASSRIRDVDVAEESARYVRLQILQQAGASVLTAANLQPELALKLLKG